jgi:hypothetical protein
MPIVLYTLDNGGNPFVVHVDPKKHEVSVYARGAKFMDGDHPERKIPHEYTRTAVKPTRFDGEVFVGCGQNKSDRGNSVLVHMSQDKYMFVGDRVFTFTTVQPNERITAFKSPVGNSAVPYPYAISDHHNVYLMVDEAVFPWQATRRDPDPYQVYYNATRGKTRKMKTKLVYKRLY